MINHRDKLETQARYLIKVWMEFPDSRDEMDEVLGGIRDTLNEIDAPAPPPLGVAVSDGVNTDDKVGS